MNKALKYILGIGGTSLAFLGGRYLYRLNRAGNKVVTEVSGRVHKVSFQGVVVVMNYNIKNPTNVSIEMTAPLITLAYNKAILASSSMDLVEIPESVKTRKGTIQIPANGETGIITTSILLPTLSLLGAGADLLTRLKDRLNPDLEAIPIKIAVNTTATVFTRVGSVPYDETVTVKI